MPFLALVLQPAQCLIGAFAPQEMRRESCGERDEANESHHEDHGPKHQGDGNPEKGTV